MKTQTAGLLAASLLFLAGFASAADTDSAAPPPAATANGEKGPTAEEAQALATAQAEANAALAAAPAAERDMCLIPGRPAGQDGNYQVLRKLKAARQTYGSVVQVLPELASKAKSAGGDAIFDYNGAQRFGFFPWRLVRPVATGTAIRWTGSQPLDCAALGGRTTAEVIASNQAPDRPASTKQ
ncbi:hypothetical protein [Pelomonas sp. KK5]|uniref:hypothetical protein n=1 Tax=Pelomonas sp. KK5 TaxID=1855730 RepID=UPI00097C044F|nr:hypothetical protein [Pelomonas sp. KK5]